VSENVGQKEERKEVEEQILPEIKEESLDSIEQLLLVVF